MPTYEMPLLLKVMTKPELVTTLKRTAESIFEKGGFLRKIDNLGRLPTPFKISANGRTHKEANYFIIHFDVAPAKLERMNAELRSDVDIVRHKIYGTNNPEKVECTFHEEMLPAAYRPDVLKLMEIGAKERARRDTRNKKFKYNSGLDYYPFQR